MQLYLPLPRHEGAARTAQMLDTKAREITGRKFLSVIQEGVVVLVSLMGPLGWRQYAKLMIFLHIQVGAPCLPFPSLFTEG